MNIRRIVKTAAVLGIGLIGTLSLTHTLRSAHAQDGPGGHGHRRHGGGLMRLCHGDMDANLNRMAERLETELDLSSEQKQNLDAIAQAIKSSDLQASCATSDEAPPATALDKLAHMESRLETGLSTIQQIRPSVETFYNSLSAEQQTELDSLMPRRHRR